VVWEETIILLQDKVKMAFLSATIPNARQFAEWISYLHQQPCHVISTDRRPVPLEHYIYVPGNGQNLYLEVVDTEVRLYRVHWMGGYIIDGLHFRETSSHTTSRGLLRC